MVQALLAQNLPQIMLDALPAQALSVPCEQVFSTGKQISDYLYSQLGAEQLNHIQMLKFAWSIGQEVAAAGDHASADLAWLQHGYTVVLCGQYVLSY
jgi:hypothetical protein